LSFESARFPINGHIAMLLRANNIHRLSTEILDTLVVGGGINGAVTAAAIAARGAKAGLIDARDFAGVSSQQSSNLAWGGIKYMESMEFGLVRKLCASRNELLRSYPSSVKEIRFLTMHERGFRHSLLKLFAGTWLYWLFGNGFTRKPQLLSTKRIRQLEPIINTALCDGGLEYSDAYLIENDARFVFQFIQSALDFGCAAANYVESLGGRRERDGLWHVDALDKVSGTRLLIRARTLVNACGAFVDDHNGLTNQVTTHRHIFSKGVHLVVDQLTPSKKILTFFADDGRLFFAIPMGDKTCIGTTDTPVTNPLPEVTDEDRDFIISNIEKRLNLKKPLAGRVIAERCGVRPLVVRSDTGSNRDWLQLSRKHVVESSLENKHASIFGGKLTDCINVGEEMSDLLQKMGVNFSDANRRWFGEPGDERKADFLKACVGVGLSKPSGPAREAQSNRLWRLYGERAFELLKEIELDPNAASILIDGCDYMACEFAYAGAHEMVTSLEDFLRRRTKIALTVRHDELRRSPGLRIACELMFGAQGPQKLDEYFNKTSASAATVPIRAFA
jgi:glycerol-3-phosphate dehydrogenase